MTEFDRVLKNHQAQIQGIAHNMGASWIIPENDLCAIGAEGLWEAWCSYDASQGADLWGFAQHRVKGAMRDAIRETTKFWQQAANAAYGSVQSLDTSLETAEGSIARVDAVEDIALVAIPDAVEASIERADVLAIVVDRLPERWRTVLGLLFVEGLNYAEAAQVMGISRQRLRQIALEAAGVVRKALVADGKVGVADEGAREGNVAEPVGGGRRSATTRA